MPSRYSYPVTNKFEARAVTEPNFEPELFEGDHPLYVNLDSVRGDDFWRDALFKLNLDAEEDAALTTPTADYVQVIVSGHRGCGKTAELERLHARLHRPDRYFAVLLSFDKEIELDSFQPVDLFVWMILLLIRALDKAGIKVGTTHFEELARQLLSDTTHNTENKRTLSGEVSAETGGGFSFFGLAQIAAKAKTVLAGTNATSTTIREAVRRNTLNIVRQFNEALVDVRAAVKAAGKGQDVAFIIDGSEKIKYDKYEWLFVQNPNLLQEVAMNMLVAVPISSFYQIKSNGGSNFPNELLLPMIKLSTTDPEAPANRCFREIIERRIDVPTFFADGVLDRCIVASGGCIRQLLIIVNRVIVKTRGERASLEVAEKAIYDYGLQLYGVLTSAHVAILQRGPDHWLNGDPGVQEMLFQLVLLKFNGHKEINPVLKPFVPLPADAAPAA